MENANKKKLIDVGIKGLCLFIGLVVFLFTILGEKCDDGLYVFRFYYDYYFHGKYAENFYFLFPFLFSYLEMLVLFYIRDKKINNITTHIICIIYSFIVTFILYLNIINDDYEEYSIKFSGFVWLLLTIEITYLILMYKEDDLRRILPSGNIIKINKFKNKKNNNEMLPEAAFLNNLFKKKPRMFSHPFSFTGRIRRLEYCISFLIWLVLNPFIIAVINHSVVSSILFLPTFWFIIAQGVKRCHDLGHSGWYQLVPFYELFMLFEGGDPYINKYGHNPK